VITRNETINEATRAPVQLASRAVTTPGKKSGPPQVWYSGETSTNDEVLAGFLQRLPNFEFTGVLLGMSQLRLAEKVPPSLKLAVRVSSAQELTTLLEFRQSSQLQSIVISADELILEEAGKKGFVTCLYQFVDDGVSLRRSIELGMNYPFLMIRFRDPTNIPLELVIASLQSTGTVLIKEINDPADVDDAIVSLGVMEVGADGVMYSPLTHEHLDQFARGLAASRQTQIGLEIATVMTSMPIGMGYRSCIDLATLFEPTEGMIVGSTSQGGILCCPEVFYLPYMETRPFRVNAGAVHSYVFNSGNRTDYMSELKVGMSVMIAGLDGKTRNAPVGRIKTEMRPLRLIEARFESGETINVIMQDDWHVRVFSPDGKPLNVTELKPGSRVLAHKNDPGRHVGIKISEKILEK
jgi:3-amino-4-hydroxybenzoic acid synthase